MSNGSRLRGLLQRTILVGLGFILAEGILQIASRLVPAVDFATRPAWTIEPRLRDDQLGLRGNPFYFEHDANGFRNADVPDHADVVTLGDSQTYGVNVPPDRNWPSALARQTGLVVYNMSLAGYGAPQCEVLVDQALALHPRWIVFALYFGNDFYDAFEFALRNDRLGEVATSDTLARIGELEARRTIADEVAQLFQAGHPPPPAAPVVEAGGPRVWISTHSRLYGLGRALKDALRGNQPSSSLLQTDFEDAVNAITDVQRPFLSVFDHEWRTILTSAYRLCAEDGDDPRILAGLETTRRSIAAMHGRVEAAGARFALALIPTKEFVFWPRVSDPAEHPGLAELVAHEQRIRQLVLEDADDAGILTVDLAPALRSSPVQPYFFNADGHPNPEGHEIIAGEVASRLGLH